MLCYIVVICNNKHNPRLSNALLCSALTEGGLSVNFLIRGSIQERALEIVCPYTHL